MHRTVWWLIFIFGIGIFGAIVYNALKKPPAPETPAAEAPAPRAAAPESPTEPQIRYPIEEKPPEKPLPSLDASDATLKTELDALLKDKSFVEAFLLKDFVRRIVATVDNLPRQKLALRLMPLKPVGGPFLAAGDPTNLAISPGNAARYALHARLVDAIDPAAAVALYVRYYPLFQQAYRELGYPKGYFNDRLVEVIDHLLGAPDMPMTVKLVRPKVFYLYADPALEAQSAGRKILMRVGADNAARVKAKLRALRAELTKHAPKP